MAPSSSSDEGEIRDSGFEKATKSLPQLDGTSVDRQDRNRARNTKSPSPAVENGYRSKNRRSSDRSRSPFDDYAPRGSKRFRDDDHYDRGQGDPRRFKVHYEDRPSEQQRRTQRSYEDLDKGSSTEGDRLRYDDRDHYSDKRARTRSRSPYRAPRSDAVRGHPTRSHREGNRGGRYNDDRLRRNGYDDHSSRSARDQSVSNRGNGPVHADLSKREAKTMQGHSQQYNETSGNEPKVERSWNTAEIKSDDVVEPEALDEAALIEQRRKRREAIKAKYRGAATPMMVQALQLGEKSGDNTPRASELNRENTAASTREASPFLSTPATPKDIQDLSAFSITTDQDLANKTSVTTNVMDDGPSAADYDPTIDMQEDKERDIKRHAVEMPSSAYDETKQGSGQDILIPQSPKTAEAATEKSKNEFDMFADDDDDMFAEDTDTVKPANAEQGAAAAIPVPEAKVLDVGMLDNWDDAEGYYKTILGELLDGRYHVTANLGRGMFAAVVRATDITTKKIVAIKIIRKNETMKKAGMKEIEILQKLNQADVEDKRHIIRLERYFEHKAHMCMVFENLSMNLRDVLKKVGRDGINLTGVRVYAHQIFLGLSLMRKCNILHADLKPDNILVNEDRKVLKICDLGSASDASENEITPYLVSRFYRAPEVILGMQYDFAIDMWAVGCTLYELYTGKILFTGRSNNQMLRTIMDCRGKITEKLLRRSEFAKFHFDEHANFLSREPDRFTGRETIKTLTFTKPTSDLRTRLMGGMKGLTDKETKELNLFIDLLERCLAINPEKRCTPAEALRHPFIAGTTVGSSA